MLFLLAAAAQAAPVLMVGNPDQPVYTCESGQGVKVVGDRLRLTFRGDCGRLEVVGHGNEVTIDGVTAIQLTGNRNRAVWSRNLRGTSSLPVDRFGIGNRVDRSD